MKIGMAIMLALLLTGCASQQTMETVADEWTQPVAAAGQIQVELPDEAAVPAVDADGGRLYLCQDYTLLIQTLPGGDLDETVRSLTGYSAENLTLLKTQRQGLDRYDFVWATTAEEGTQLGRAVVLDDGNYHYAMSVLRPADGAERSQVVWHTVFDSFTLA